MVILRNKSHGLSHDEIIRIGFSYVRIIIKLGYNTYCHWLKERAL